MKNKQSTIGLLLSIIIFSCASTTYTPDQPRISWTITLTNGSQITGECEDYNDRKTEFTFHSGNSRKTFLVQDVHSLQRLQEGTQPITGTDNTDIIETTDGAVIKGIFWNWSKKDIAYYIPEEGEQGKGVLLANLKRIIFGKRVYTVERINFKKGLSFYDEKEEISMGNQFAQELPYEEFVVEDEVIGSYIQTLGNKLASNSRRTNIPYTFNVINSDQVNAFAVPGGHVYVYRGLVELANSESELAGVIGHEVGHVAGYHSAQQMSKAMLMQGIVLGVGTIVGLKNEKWGSFIQTIGSVSAFLLTMKFSRDDEREADYMGVYTLYKAGYNPKGMMTFFEKLRQSSGGDPGKFSNFFQSHPLTSERILNVNREVQKMPDIAALRETTPAFDAFKKQVEKLPKPYLISKNPAKSLGLQLQSSKRDGSGKLVLTNSSDYIISNITVKLQYKNNRGEEIGAYKFGVTGDLLPKNKATLNISDVLWKNAPEGTTNVFATLQEMSPVPKVKPELQNKSLQVHVLEK